MNFINFIFIITIGKLFIFWRKILFPAEFLTLILLLLNNFGRLLKQIIFHSVVLLSLFLLFCFVFGIERNFSFLGRPFQSLKTLSETFVFHSKCENVSEMKIFAFLFVVLTENELNCQINKSSFITNTHLKRVWGLFLTFFNCKNVKVAILHYSLTETLQNTNRS